MKGSEYIFMFVLGFIIGAWCVFLLWLGTQVVP